MRNYILMLVLFICFFLAAMVEEAAADTCRVLSSGKIINVVGRCPPNTVTIEVD